ncbi:MAG: glycerophosphodiester phosphodiesterase family protein [Xanthobacteraceae bacterium]
MRGPAWLTARPVAHRGLHDAVRGITENTASSVAAAIAAGYGIEVDLQITADGEAMVHHDDALGRLTEGQGRLDAMTAQALRRVTFKATSDRMMTLGDLCDLVVGRATLLLELKSRYDGDRRLPLRVADVLKSYSGPIAAMSFDPLQVAVVCEAAPHLLRGLVAERHFRPSQRERGSLRSGIAYFRRVLASRPQFLAYSIRDLPSPAPLVARYGLGLPLLTWTVRSEKDRQKAARWADQMIFEGFRP